MNQRKKLFFIITASILVAIIVAACVLWVKSRKPEIYTVTFQDFDGTMLKTEAVEAGKTATAPEIPVREGYTFIGWDKAFNLVTDNLTVTARYQEGIRPTLIIGSASAKPGDAAVVDVVVRNNPGLFGAILKYEFDPVLTLSNAESGEVFEPLDVTFPEYKSPFVVFCDGLDVPATGDGIIMRLTFTTPANAKNGENFTISASHLPGDVVNSNFADVELEIIAGCITIQ